MIETSIPFFFAVFFLKKTSTYKHIYTYMSFLPVLMEIELFSKMALFLLLFVFVYFTY